MPVSPAGAYRPIRDSESLFLDIRGLRHHVRRWPARAGSTPAAGPSPVVVMLHGWMDMSASFQFVVDQLPDTWTILAPDWRGFGLSARSGADCYWFPDYLADLECLLDELLPGEQPVDLVGHSMGGNVATLYAGVRPQRVRRLVNLEGLGMPGSGPEQAPRRYRRWLDELRTGIPMRDYASRDEVAARLMRNNPRLGPAQAAFLAVHWAEPSAGGRFTLLGDPAHRIVNPVLYRVDETLAVWAAIEASVLWVMAATQEGWQRFALEPAYEDRLSVIRNLRRHTVAEAGHMLHHDQPDAVAGLIREFLA
jgi:pimeloyl-ACP methyl ester carboxylesterase